MKTGPSFLPLLLTFCSILLSTPSGAQITCNDYVVVALDDDCTIAITWDMILEGGPYDSNNLLVQIDKTSGPQVCAGPWLAPVVDQNDVGQIYCVVVYDLLNGDSCLSQIEIVDNLPPVLQCPANQVRNNDPGLCSYATMGAEFDPATATDNCSAPALDFALTGAANGTGGGSLALTIFPVGFTTVRWTAEDPSANSATCTFHVTVLDAELPQVSCPTDMTLNADPGFCTYTEPGTGLEPVSWSENCPGGGIVYSLAGATTGNGSTSLTGIVINSGITTVTWLAYDAMPNIASCSFQVTVPDQDPPIITTCPPDRTVALDFNCQLLVPDLTQELVATDCTQPLTITQNPVAGTLLTNNGNQPHPVVMTVTDGAGNPSTCSVKLNAKNGHLAYVPNRNAQNVSIVDLTTNQVVSTIPGLSGPGGVSVSPNGQSVFFTNGNGNVSVVSTASNTVTATIPGIFVPFGICFNKTGTRAYVVSQFSNALISVIRTSNNTIQSTIQLTGTALGIAFNQANNRLYVTQPSLNSVTIINAANNSIVGSIQVGVNPTGVCVSPDGAKVYVSNSNSGTISVIDVASSQVTNIPVGLFPSGICTSPDGLKVYTANRNDGTVSVVDISLGQQIAVMPAGTSPYGLSIHPDGSRLYVANYDSDEVTVYDLPSNTLLTNIPVGDFPIAFGDFIVSGACVAGGGNNQNMMISGSGDLQDAEVIFSAHSDQDMLVYPNPFADLLRFEIRVEKSSELEIALFDLSGRTVISQSGIRFDPGMHAVIWNTERLLAGSYLLGWRQEGLVWTYRKVVLVR